MLDKTKLLSAMRYYMQAFNDEGVTITDQTVHEKCLADDDGFGQASSMQMYKDAVRWTLFKKGNTIKAWPLNWMKQTLDALADQLL